MANRRMCNLKIVDTDDFLDMPSSTQALYFHLIMRADDDGFVSAPKKIVKIVNCKVDDLELLVTKSYLIPFGNGVCVVSHWRLHNYIQKDRYQPTIYSDEFSRLNVSKNDVYTLDTSCIQDVSKTDTQVRLGKVSIGYSKEREGGDGGTITTPDGVPTPSRKKNESKKSQDERHKYGMYNNVLFSDDELIKLKTEFPDDWEKRIERLSEYIASTGKRYKSHLATVRAWAKNDRQINEPKKHEDNEYHSFEDVFGND